MMVDKMHNGLIVQSPMRHVPASLREFAIVQPGDIVRISPMTIGGILKSIEAIYGGTSYGTDFFETCLLVDGERPAVKIYSSERENHEYSSECGVILPRDTNLEIISDRRPEFLEKKQRLEEAGLWGVANG